MEIEGRIKAMDEIPKYIGSKVRITYVGRDGVVEDAGVLTDFKPYSYVSVDGSSLSFVSFTQNIQTIKADRRILYDNEHAKKLPCNTLQDLMYNMYMANIGKTFGDALLNEILE